MKSYAVDFDDTLNFAGSYPELGEPNRELIQFLKERRQEGDKVILWTCREGSLLKSAVKFCKNYGLEFDAVNDNLRENTEYFGSNSRKVYADYYIDDKNRGFKNLPGVALREKSDMQRVGIAEYVMQRIGKQQEIES